MTNDNQLVSPFLLRSFDEQEGVILFVGAGMGGCAVDKQGREDAMPTADDLCCRLASLFDPPLNDWQKRSLGELSEYYLYSGIGDNKTNLVRWLADQLGESPDNKDLRRYLPKDVASAISDIPFAGFITTNYDSMLERALRDNDREVTVFSNNKVVPAFRDDRIHKIAGTIENPESVLITDYDLETGYGTENSEIVAKVQEAYNKNTILFVGYSRLDPFFRLSWANEIKRSGKFARRHYAVKRTVNELERRYWDRRNISIISSDGAAFLKSLRDTIAPAKDLDWHKSQLSQLTGKTSVQIDEELATRMERNLGKPELETARIWLMIERSKANGS